MEPGQALQGLHQALEQWRGSAVESSARGNRPEDTQGESMMNESGNVSHLKLFEPAGICPSGVAVRLFKSENLKSKVTPP